jgi:hypothetical protein
MPALKTCAHISKFKREKFSQQLTKFDLECSFKHSDIDTGVIQNENMSICGDCGLIACSHQGARADTKNSSCIEKHCLTSKHWVQVEVLSKVAYCYKCDCNLNELLIELQADDKLANNPLTIKLESYLENIPVIIHTWQQRLIKKRPENLNDRVMLADPYKDDYMGRNKMSNTEYFEEKNNEETRKPIKAKNTKLQRNLVNFPEKIFGLANNDNTCFMAVILQCLNGNP